ncbi:CDKN2A-interacting protein-like isoform X2 [Acipenser ruthenus]|uniref:CDKN2A-interacting protein-like isoform X2 n=1 Tax=Acipenser ruthenus TaxID=7906 RepID=UPI0027408536|nr:CDKN2A-interacting protein-like isoform X2 [Acipenser ruthenus]
MTGDVVLHFGKSVMAEGRSGDDVVSEFLQQNPHLAQWVESLAGESETEKQWSARREFILRNMEGFPTIQPGSPSPSLDRLISLSMVWANHIFLGCRYPQPVMDKITEMAEGIAVQNAPTHKTRDEIMGMSKDASKKPKPGVSYRAKTGPTLQAPKEHQPFFNRLYKAIAWKLVSAGGFGPNIDHFEILRTCVESAKASLGCVFVPLKDIPDLPAGRAQQGGLVCELRCQTVYLGTGYGRGEDSARAMAAKEALKLFQSRKVTVKIFRRKYSGRDVEDLVLHDDQMRNSSFPPALSYPFDPE